MYEKIAEFVHSKYTLLAFILVVCLMLAIFLYGLRQGRENNNVNGAIQSVEQSASRAGEFIVSTERKIDNAEVSLNRAGEAIKSSRVSNSKLQAGIDECEELVDKCLERNRSAQGIVEDIRAGYRARETKSQDN